MEEKEENLQFGEMTEAVPEPFWLNGENINGTKPFFFHGTTKKALQGIQKYGFSVPTLRPTFSLNPVFSLAYCRKSESYLRGLIRKGMKRQLEKEIKELIAGGVIAHEELEDETYQWWISKADKYYQKTSDITKTGVLLVFDLPRADLVTPKVSKLQIKHIGAKTAIFGAPSIWRTRQFGFKGPEGQTINLSKYRQARIILNRKFVKALKALYGNVKNGSLNVDNFGATHTVLNQSVEIEELDNLGTSKTLLVDSLISQTIDSVLIRGLRDDFVAAVCLGGLKVFWEKNIEDDRWYKPEDEIESDLRRLGANEFPDDSWKKYLAKNSAKVRKLQVCPVDRGDFTIL